MSHHKTPLGSGNWEEPEEFGISASEAHENPRRLKARKQAAKEADKARRLRQQFHRARWG